jgi:hypothetical protein
MCCGKVLLPVQVAAVACCSVMCTITVQMRLCVVATCFGARCSCDVVLCSVHDNSAEVLCGGSVHDNSAEVLCGRSGPDPRCNSSPGFIRVCFNNS